jgi:hypothetical protein
MRYLIAVLLSAALIWTVQQETPVHKSFADTASTKKVTVAVKTSTPKETPQVQTVQPVTAPTEAVVTPAVSQPTTHEELMAAAGIQPADYGAVDYIITHESGWNANATNASSGAHGLPQALPYSKTGCGWVDEVCQMKWANTYAVSRYGGWWNAQAYWATHGNW